MTANEFREAVFQLVASPVDGLSFEDKAAIVRHAVTPRPITVPSSAKIQAHGYVLLCVLILLMVVGGVTATVWLNWGGAPTVRGAGVTVGALDHLRGRHPG